MKDFLINMGVRVLFWLLVSVALLGTILYAIFFAFISIISILFISFLSNEKYNQFINFLSNKIN